MSEAAVVSRRWRRPPLIASARLRWLLGIGAAIYFATAIGSLEVNWLRVYEGLDRGWAFFVAFTEPDFTTRWTDIRGGLIESLTMTVTSTVLGIAIRGRHIKIVDASLHCLCDVTRCLLG